MTLVSVIFLGLICVAVCDESYVEHIFDNKVSEKDAQLINNIHNKLRDLISKGEVTGQPRGINLKRMKYDSQLAAKAQKIANRCKFEHEKVDDGRWHVGQNLYISYSTAASNESDWSAAIQSWFDEYKDYHYGRCCERGPKMTGHYTQVVWADTEYVGCGWTYYRTRDAFKYHKLYVCNYGPAGNWVGQCPYNTNSTGYVC